MLGLLALAGIAALALAGTGISGCASGVPGAHASPTSAGGGFSLSGAIVCSLAFAIAIALRRKKRKPREVLDSRPPPRPRVASPAPHVVAHSIPGLVRERNEDRVLVGRVRDIDLVVVADGMGGHARGEDAADIATSFAMLTALRRLAELPTSEAHAVRAVLLETIWHAAGELARAARGGERDALRCTLILVAVTKSAVVAAWIGDGAVSLVRATGAVVELLEPHRTPEGRQNLLHSSLGPITDGRPSWCIATREPGDVLAVMTDGVADHRDASFADDLARIARSRSSERALVRWLDALAHERDPNGTILREDNLTIAIHSGG
ncbi:MAG: protein phosphatase 2C domain-containing protein [Myxococcales bacterium]|nr:protein phosphatase 2C domain-containing protein [Myxococcales bacterium]